MSENNVSFTAAGLLEVTTTEQANLAIPNWLAEALLVGQYWGSSRHTGKKVPVQLLLALLLTTGQFLD